MDDPSFFDLFCSAFDCAPEDFSAAVFWLCLFPQAIFLARLLWRLHRNYFRPDFDLINRLKTVTSLDDFSSELNDYRRFHPVDGFLRTRFHLRVSGRLLLALAEKLFKNATPHIQLSRT